MSRICFVENDAILKLVACDLFWEAVANLGANQASLYVLAEAKYVFGSSRVARRYPQTIREKAIAIAASCQQVGSQLSGEFQELEIDGIDPGEMQLISAMISERRADSPVYFYLVTGDKRCLKALAAATQLAEIRQKLSGRVICLEQLILRLINTLGFEEVLTRVLPAREYDRALAAILGSGSRATRENVLLALEGYIENLRQEIQELLALY